MVAVESERAVVEVDGKQRALLRGQHYQQRAASDRQSMVLAADGRGHFIAEGGINGKPVRFVVDTGATVVALPASEAVRLGIDYRKGRPGTTSTAGGPVPVYRVMFDTVKVGGIELQRGGGPGDRAGPGHRAARHELPQPRGDEERGPDHDPHPPLLMRIALALLFVAFGRGRGAARRPGAQGGARLGGGARRRSSARPRPATRRPST